MLDPILAPLGDFAGSLPSQPPQIKLISNLTGQAADERTYADPGYWVRHARSPVQFAAGIQTLADCGCDVFLEIGPSPTLIGMGQRCLTGESLRWLPSLRPGRDDWQTLLESLAELYVTRRADRLDRIRPRLPAAAQGVAHLPVPAEALLGEVGRAEPAGQRVHASAEGASLHPLLGRRLAAAVTEQVFESQLAANRPPILADHKVQGVVVMPGAAYLEMALAASVAVYGKPWDVCEATLVEPLLLDKRPKTVQTILTPEGDNAAAFRIVSLDGDGSDDEPSFTTHAVGRLEAPAAAAPPVIDIAAQQARFTGPPFDDAWRIEALRKIGLGTRPFVLLGPRCTGATSRTPWPSCASPGTATTLPATTSIPACWTAPSNCWGLLCPAPAPASTPMCP